MTKLNRLKPFFKSCLTLFSSRGEVKTVPVKDGFSVIDNVLYYVSGKTKIKAIPHKDCASGAPADFSSDCAKATKAYWRMSRSLGAR